MATLARVTGDAAERMIEQAARHEQLTATGRPTAATVTGVNMLTTAGGDPELELDLDVELDGRSFAVRHRQLVGPLVVRELKVGARIRVVVDAVDPTVLLIA